MADLRNLLIAKLLSGSGSTAGAALAVTNSAPNGIQGNAERTDI